MAQIVHDYKVGPDFGLIGGQMPQDRLCPNGQHDIVNYGFGSPIACSRCPLTLDVREFALARDRRGMQDALRRAEREWYIRELES